MKPFHELVKFPFMMAPMVGLSHVAFRELVQFFTPDSVKTIWPTEMLSSRRLPCQNVGQTPETFRGEREEFLVPQILGNERRFIDQSMKKIEAWGAVGVDINMGCPVKKALKHNYGVSLMGDPEYASDVVRMTVESTNLPVSVKFRAGLQKNEDVLLKFAKGIEDAGASWVCLHPRSAEQKRRGNADWSQITLLKNELRIPVIGNGDVQNYQDAIRMKEETNCDAVMIGRALTARPWLLWQISHHLGFNDSPVAFQGSFPKDGTDEAVLMGIALKKFVQLCYLWFDEKAARKRILFYLRVCHPWLNFGHSLDAKMRTCQNQEEFQNTLTSFFDKSGLSLSLRTELRY